MCISVTVWALFVYLCLIKGLAGPALDVEYQTQGPVGVQGGFTSSMEPGRWDAAG